MEKRQRGRPRGAGSSSTRGKAKPRKKARQESLSPVSVDFDEELDPAPQTVTEPDVESSESETEIKDKPQEDENDDFAEYSLVPLTAEEEKARREVLDGLDEEQMARYETYRRSRISKSMMKKHLQQIVGTVPAQVPIIVASAAKLFVGDIVERAKEVMEDWKQEGPIRPEHLREAYRRYREETRNVAPAYRKKLF